MAGSKGKFVCSSCGYTSGKYVQLLARSRLSETQHAFLKKKEEFKNAK